MHTVEHLKSKFYRINGVATGASLYERLHEKLQDLVTLPLMETKPELVLQAFETTGFYPVGTIYRGAIISVCQDMRMPHDEVDVVLKLMNQPQLGM